MSDLKMISPLLDCMTVEDEPSGQKGHACFVVRNVTSGERFILKRMSIPASDSQIDALILSGAYPDEAAVHEYYGRVVGDIKAELAVGKKLAATGNFSGVIDYQVEPRESGVGYDVYILYPLYVPLSDLMAKNAITNLRAINLGIDMCDAIAACRNAGYLFGNMKPENIFLLQSGKFLLGDLGLVALQDLKYACMPEEYIGKYAAPELSDFAAPMNPTIDLYSLGMVLFRIYNGSHEPFEDEETGEGMAERLRLTGKQIPTPMYADYELASIILRACAFKPEDRFQTPEEFKQTLMLYMQRNEVSDALIVPPIVASNTPIVTEEGETEEEVVRMTNAEELDENFRKSFEPDLTGAGSEKDIDPTAEGAPQPQKLESDVLDSSNVDVEEFVATVSKAVDEPPEIEEKHVVHVPTSGEEVDEMDSLLEEEEPDREESRRSFLGKLAIIVGLVAAIGVAVYFLLGWFFIEVQSIHVESTTASEAVVVLSTEDGLEKLVLTCTDSYGKEYPVTLVDGKYHITGLDDDTTYTITVSAGNFHGLSSAGQYSMDFTTKMATEILEILPVRGENDGEVQFGFKFTGPEPTKWYLSYYKEQEPEQTEQIEFTGTNAVVSELEINQVYVFALSAEEGYYLSGNVPVSFEVVPIVEAKNLEISEITESSIVVTWEAGKNLPEEWQVSCTPEGGEAITKTTKQSTCTFEVTDFDKSYTISVLAPRGMDKPAEKVLPANPYVINDLKAETQDDGGVKVSWSTLDPLPEGYYFSYNTTGSYHTDLIFKPEDHEEDSGEDYIVLYDLIPDCSYDLELIAPEEVFGTCRVNFTTERTDLLDTFDFGPDAPLSDENEGIFLYVRPEEWTEEDKDHQYLGDPKDTFTTEELIAVCLEMEYVNRSGRDISLFYVVRDQEGHVVNFAYKDKDLTWSDMWYDRHHTNEIPMPCAEGAAAVPGSYTFEIYVNGMLLATKAFTIQ